MTKLEKSVIALIRVICEETDIQKNCRNNPKYREAFLKDIREKFSEKVVEFTEFIIDNC